MKHYAFRAILGVAVSGALWLGGAVNTFAAPAAGAARGGSTLPLTEQFTLCKMAVDMSAETSQIWAQLPSSVINQMSTYQAAEFDGFLSWIGPSRRGQMLSDIQTCGSGMWQAHLNLILNSIANLEEMVNDAANVSDVDPADPIDRYYIFWGMYSQFHDLVQCAKCSGGVAGATCRALLGMQSSPMTR